MRRFFESKEEMRRFFDWMTAKYGKDAKLKEVADKELAKCEKEGEKSE